MSWVSGLFDRILRRSIDSRRALDDVRREERERAVSAAVALGGPTVKDPEVDAAVDRAIERSKREVVEKGGR